MKTIYLFFLLSLTLFVVGCQDADNEEVHPSEDRVSAKGATQVRELTPQQRASLDPSSCLALNRLEIDVYDSDYEYINPSNYRLELIRNGRVVTTYSFDQYCTMNNVFEKKNLKAGLYTYRITTTCSKNVYTGQINYVSGYYGLSLRIDQRLCK